jgi:ribulose-5-phosphate 4-epimerase/fuculose-1-phosphate aldolase
MSTAATRSVDTTSTPAPGPGDLWPYSGAASIEDERGHRKQRLAASFRLLAKMGYDEGLAGHITARDPEVTDHFWVNPFGMAFGRVKVSDLQLVNSVGEVVEGGRSINRTAFTIHSQVHAARPDVVSAVHSHTLHGRAFASLGRPLKMITQDHCDFYRDHSVYSSYHGVALDLDEGKRIADALGPHKAVILQNHGLLTVGHTVEEATWWFIRLERCCQMQLIAEAAGTPTLVDDATASQVYEQQGSHLAGWFTYRPLYESIVETQPDLLD